MADETRRDAGAGPTRREDVAAGATPTRRDGQPTVSGVGAGPTLRDDRAAVPRRSLYNLPAALDEDFAVIEPLPTGGAEAELLIVEAKKDKQRAVAKIYRPGIEPKTDVLDRIARMAPQYVVRLLQHGVSDGLSYELLEYCRFGSLRRFLRGHPIPADWVRRFLVEIHEALVHLHGQGIIHRDLKPENVLIRATEPLDLVLTDFGIASVSEASQHFTTASRTVKYGAPEAASGVISPKVDYWSLGMILVEALTGHHPFEGLSEPVINQRLATRPVDLSALADENWRLLCRGLLHRNPEERWDKELVGRWLRGERTLAAAPDEAVERAPAAVRPYQLEKELCLSARELAVGLARNWQVGARDLARGFIAAWIRDELKDLNLSRFLLDLADDANLSPDGRLLRLLVRLAPDLPPIWRGEPLEEANLIAIATRAVAGDKQAGDWIDVLDQQDVLAVYASAGVRRFAEMEQRRKASAAEVNDCIDQLADEETTLVKEMEQEDRSADGPADMDDLMYGSAGPKLGRPAVPRADLLLAILGKDYESVLRSQVRSRHATLAADCEWLSLFGPEESLNTAQLLAMKAMLPHAEAWAARVRERRSRRAKHETDRIRSFCSDIDAVIVQMRRIEHSGFTDVDGQDREALQTLIGSFRDLDAQAAALESTTREGQHLQEVLPRIRSNIRAIDAQLGVIGRWHLQGSVTGGAIALAAWFGGSSIRLPVWVSLLATVIAAGAYGLFALRGRRARAEVRRLIRRLPLASAAQ